MAKLLVGRFAAAILAIGALAGCQTSDPTSPSAEGNTQITGLDAGAIRFQAGGALFTMSNAADGNEILRYRRNVNGSLVALPPIDTGGLGTGTGLGNQGGIAIAPDESWMVAVNAGSNDISVFRIRGLSAMLTDVEPSLGTMPISVTIHENLIYVLNAGSPGGIQGFELDFNGELTPIDGSAQGLSGSDVGPAQIAFSPDGSVLIVTEKMTNNVVTYDVGSDGTSSGPNVHASAGQTPFGFAITESNYVFVSEAFGGAVDASAVSSYQLVGGNLNTVDPSVPTNQTAACWVAVTPDENFVYTTNTGSGSITGYQVMASGEIEILDQDGRTGVTGDGSSPIDLTISRDGRYLFALLSGTHEIAAFEIGSDGSLSPLPFESGIPMGANGLAGF
jgi:6-phosphogluconolactonase (cycloisomerase 2 family)